MQRTDCKRLNSHALVALCLYGLSVLAGCASAPPEEPAYRFMAAEPIAAAASVRPIPQADAQPPSAVSSSAAAMADYPVEAKPRPGSKAAAVRERAGAADDRVPVTTEVSGWFSPERLRQPGARARRQPAGMKMAAAPADVAAEMKLAMEATAAGPATPAAGMYDGSTAYYLPRRMVESRASFAHLWLDRKVPVADLRQELAGYLQQTVERIRAKSGRMVSPDFTPPAIAEIEGGSVVMGDTMIAHLRGGDDFDIDPKGPVTQSLAGENRARWNWRVTPRRASDEGMLLSLDVWIDPGHGSRLIESFHEKVIVTARPRTPFEILQELDKWLLLLGAGGVGGMVAWLWKILARNNRSKGGQEADAA